VKDSFRANHAGESGLDQRADEEICMALRPDSFCERSVKNHMEELAHEDAQRYMGYWYRAGCNG